jgi:hypothetical protein
MIMKKLAVELLNVFMRVIEWLGAAATLLLTPLGLASWLAEWALDNGEYDERGEVLSSGWSWD